MGFSREEYWSGLPFPSPGDLLNPGTGPTSLKSPALAGRFFITCATWEAHMRYWRTEEPGVLQSVGLQRVGHNLVTKLPWWLRGRSVCLQCGRPGFNPWVGKIPWRRKWQPTPVFLPGESHGWSLVGYSPWSRKESSDYFCTF